MARTARIKSKTGIYHIVLRGNNKQQIFLEEEDYKRLLDIVSDYSKSCDYSILAYCLMGNHIHLLLKTGETELAKIMKRIVVKFVYYYNTKYDRVGHLFQDRFKSEPVENDEYLLEVVRYIHQNPIKANICYDIGEYEYSSYKQYVDKELSPIVDTSFILDIIPIYEFINFHKQIDKNINCIDIVEKIHSIGDKAALHLVYDILKKYNVQNLNEQPKEIQIKVARMCKENGLLIRQIVRLTGITKRIVELS